MIEDEYPIALKKIFTFLFLVLSLLASGQNGYRHMAGFISDNDKYSALTKDRYYTNGLTLQYDFLAKKPAKKALKTIYSLAVGQYIYTPYRAYVPHIANQDRPFAGYLFVNFSRASFYRNRSILRLTFQAGVLGPDSQAETIQQWLHHTFHLSKVAGWKYQIHNQFGINLQAAFMKNFLYSRRSLIDLNAFAKIKAGTVFDEATIGIMSRLGVKPLHALANTFLFHSNLSKKLRKSATTEAYFFIKLQLSYVAYNATLQGSLFNDNSPLTFPPKRLKAGIQTGIVWSIRHFNLIYAVSWFTKAVDNNRVKPHNYGTIALAFRF
jgi:lipid A 3-O-deacylase